MLVVGSFETTNKVFIILFSFVVVVKGFWSNLKGLRFGHVFQFVILFYDFVFVRGKVSNLN